MLLLEPLERQRVRRADRGARRRRRGAARTDPRRSGRQPALPRGDGRARPRGRRRRASRRASRRSCRPASTSSTARERQVMERGVGRGPDLPPERRARAHPARADVEPQLVGLVRKELIHPAQATFSGDHAFRFRHLLIRDAAYDALPKETRAELHERFAGWLAEHGAGADRARRGGRLPPRAGGTVTGASSAAPDAELERAAGVRLRGAPGTRASVAATRTERANLLGRAVALLPESDPARVTALVDRIAMLEQTADPERDAAIAQLETSERPEAAGTRPARTPAAAADDRAGGGDGGGRAGGRRGASPSSPRPATTSASPRPTTCSRGRAGCGAWRCRPPRRSSA